MHRLGDGRGHMMDVIHIVHNGKVIAEKVNNVHLGNMHIVYGGWII